jgi:arginase
MKTSVKDQTKTVCLIGFPIDLGADRRGVDMGPSAIRIAGLEERLRRLGYTVVDEGDIHIQIMERQKAGDPKLKYLKEILKTSEVLSRRVEKTLERGRFPLCLGGDHSMSIGSIAGVSAYCRKRKLTAGIIWIDAHADMNTDQTTPSGNIHGMPLAAAVGLGNKALVNFNGFAPKLRPENVALVGIRSIDASERLNVKKAGVSVFTMTDIDRQGINRIIGKILTDFKKRVDHIHVSFDLDSIDPTIAPGVGTPVRGGLSYREAHVHMEAIADCGCMSSFEITEVNPILDDRNKSAELAVELIASALGQRIL